MKFLEKTTDAIGCQMGLEVPRFEKSEGDMDISK